jgi:putative PEP-CTERM system histidine kinase
LFLGVLLLANFRGRLQGGLLLAAAVTTMLWASAFAWNAWQAFLTPLQLFIIELANDAAWLAFLSALLGGAVSIPRYWLVRHGGVMLAAVVLLYGVWQSIYPVSRAVAPDPGGTLVLGSLLTSLYALILTEQIYRNARESQRRGLKYLCMGVGAMFAYDLLLYSNAILVGKISPLLWGARGFVVAMCAPLIAVAAQRSPSWSVGIFVSRHVVFYTATIFGAGIYLTAVGVAGYFIRAIGAEWGPAAQIVFFAAAVIVLVGFLLSDRTRARLRVLISKHFFENKYDYRKEWLRLIETLTSDKDTLPLKKRALKAIADILGSPCATLWIKSDETNHYYCCAGWNIDSDDRELQGDHSLIVFLSKSGWIVDITEYYREPSKYQGLELDASKLGLPNPAYIVPLKQDAELFGFVVLDSPDYRKDLNFEDCDLLKAAGNQVASYLSQEAATEQLAMSRQFEAYNKLTAYLMHDLKNVIAQQSLIVANAERHKDNPAFIEDVFGTVKGSVRRMRRVIEHLQQGPADKDKHLERVEVGKLVMQAISMCADRQPVPRATLSDAQVWVHADPDRLSMALYHGIRNAQDATDADGEVKVAIATEGSLCSVTIEDTGKGMDDTFIRERLFKPFFSTKGTQGMGIGAYQIRETLRSMGGSMRVTSQPGEGTTICLEFQQAESTR